jgi:GTPase
MFIDEIEIIAIGGKGGSGVIGFRREKFIPKGGPDGGCGGKGGDVLLISNENVSSLSDFQFTRIFRAENGGSGEGNNKSGKSGEDIIINVPVGTIVYEVIDDKKMFVSDLNNHGDSTLIAKGGTGGKGNSSFANSKNQTPRIAEKGSLGEEKHIYLELKIIADVGIVGFPNAGKSTLLNSVSKAKPKIGDYQFTTLYPSVGIIDYSPKERFSIADLPGIIQGASVGKGLGYKFLRHIERCRILLYLLDMDSEDPKDIINSFETLLSELERFDQKMLDKPSLICGNKIDLERAKKNIKPIEKYLKNKKYKYFFISGINKEGISEVLDYINNELKNIPKTEFKIEKEVIYSLVDQNIAVSKISDKVYLLKFDKIERIVEATDLSYPGSIKYLLKLFKKYNIDEILKLNGIKEGDVVEIGGKRFEWV